MLHPWDGVVLRAGPQRARSAWGREAATRIAIQTRADGHTGPTQRVLDETPHEVGLRVGVSHALGSSVAQVDASGITAQRTDPQPRVSWNWLFVECPGTSVSGYSRHASREIRVQRGASCRHDGFSESGARALRRSSCETSNRNQQADGTIRASVSPYASERQKLEFTVISASAVS